MRFLGYAVASLVVAAFGNAEASTAPIWPDQGVMKVSASKTPSLVKWSMGDCFKVIVDKSGATVRVLDYQSVARSSTESKFAQTLKANGSLIILAMRQEGSLNFVVTAEGEDGSLQTVTTSTYGDACPLTSLHLTGDDPRAFDTVIVQNTEEIQRVLQSSEL